jgi:type I restriction enzyme R subunit
LKNRLTSALKKLNLRNGHPWLDDARVARAIRDLEQAAGHRLMDTNKSATELLLKGTVADGLPDWDFGRQQPVRFIDFENPGNNDFLVINQFTVELASGRRHVIPEAVLFVKGIPVVVAEFKSPGIENPIEEAINQLLRYSNHRREIWPSLYTDSEGVERLFHTNQLLIASDFFEAPAGPVGAPPEPHLEVARQQPRAALYGGLDLLTPPSEVGGRKTAHARPRAGRACWHATFFRKPDQKPPRYARPPFRCTASRFS